MLVAEIGLGRAERKDLLAGVYQAPLMIRRSLLDGFAGEIERSTTEAQEMIVMITSTVRRGSIQDPYKPHGAKLGTHSRRMNC